MVECTKERAGACLCGLRRAARVWYILIMRNWVRERMRRRSKRGPNTSESTGKIGQELPQNQPAPLQPNYAGVDYRASSASEQADTSPDLPGQEPDSVVADNQQPPVIGSDLGVVGPESDAAADGAASVNGSEQERSQDQSPQQAAPEQGASRETQSVPQGDGDSSSSSPAANNAEPERKLVSEGKLVLETQPESPSGLPSEQAGAQRPSRGFVVLTIGLPGSGKTTWFKRRGVTPLSSDMLRSILFDDITEQRYQGLVFSTLRSLLRARLIAKMPWNYVDATNLSPHERRQWIKMAKSFGYEVQAVFFDVPFEICMERNRRRERTVSDESMQKMGERLRPPSFKEGFSKITVVRVKGQPAPTPESAMSAPVPPDLTPDDPDLDDPDTGAPEIDEIGEAV